jgi:predicted nucleic acid-binding Zn ribbon protein
MIVLVFSDTDERLTPARASPPETLRVPTRIAQRSHRPHNAAVAQNAFRSAQTLLPQVLSNLARESGHPRGLLPAWKRAAGERIAQRARPVALEENVLTVAVPDRTWLAELERQEPALRARLQAEVGSWVARLVFRVDGTT